MAYSSLTYPFVGATLWTSKLYHEASNSLCVLIVSTKNEKFTEAHWLQYLPRPSVKHRIIFPLHYSDEPIELEQATKF
jgi:hypothetical protein